jgi:hypothetical protein
MCKVSFFLIVIICGLFAQFSWAGGGDSVGNGGVLWACRSGSGGQVFHAGLLSDLFEAREQYGLKLIADPGGDPLNLYEQRKTWLQLELPDMFTALKTRFEYVEQHQTFVNAELLSTNDFNNAIKPLASQCSQGEWKPLNIANFREEDQQVLISTELWNNPRLATLDKAALLFHEAIYYWMRTYFGSTDSDKSRRITGLLFSTLPTEKIKSEITKVLGSYPDRPEAKYICVMKNSKRNQIYVAYDLILGDASLTVRTRCQDDVEPNWCERSSIECEEITQGPRHRCIAENAVTRKIYTGQGRNLVEAQFNAHMACYIGSQAHGAATQQCPDFAFMECD